jgi:hypothetical protein
MLNQQPRRKKTVFKKKVQKTKEKKKTNRNGQWTQTSRHFNQTKLPLKHTKITQVVLYCSSVTGTIET